MLYHFHNILNPSKIVKPQIDLGTEEFPENLEVKKMITDYLKVQRSVMRSMYIDSSYSILRWFTLISWSKATYCLGLGTLNSEWPKHNPGGRLRWVSRPLGSPWHVLNPEAVQERFFQHRDCPWQSPQAWDTFWQIPRLWIRHEALDLKAICGRSLNSKLIQFESFDFETTSVLSIHIALYYQIHALEWHTLSFFLHRQNRTAG